MNTDPARYSTLSLPVSFRGGDADFRRRLEELYSACRVAPIGPIGLELDIEFDEAEHVYELGAFGQPFLRSPVRDDVLEWIAWKVNSVALERARSELVLHASAVAREGRAAIVTGPSGAGKSTLAAALTLRGMEYMGDDSLIVERATGQIRSNPKPVALDDSSRVALSALDPTNAELRHARQLFAPVALGAVVAAECAVEPTLIVHAAFRPGAPTVVAPLAPAAAAELLAEQSFNFATLGSAGLHAVATLARRCRAVVVEFGDLGEAVDAISAAMVAMASEVPAARPGRTAWRRPGLEVELLEGHALIWDTRTFRLHHLSESATAIWLACDASTEPGEVTARIASATRRRPDELREPVERCIEEFRALDLLPGGTE